MIAAAKYFRGMFLMTSLVAFLSFINLVQFSTLFVWPFSRSKFMRANMEIKQFYCGLVAKAAIVCGNKVICSGDRPIEENSIIFSNHQSMVDIVLVWLWSSNIRTIGWIKWFAKDSIKYTPFLGWGMRFVNTIFVKRDWAKDQDSIRKTFATIMRSRLPTWLMIFPEGTRLTAAKIAQNHQFAAQKNLPILDHVLYPRGKGIYSCIQGLAGHLDSLYDVTIQYEGVPPKLMEFYTKGGFTVYAHATRVPVNALPKTEREFNAWLLDVYVQKNERLARGLKNQNQVFSH